MFPKAIEPATEQGTTDGEQMGSSLATSPQRCSSSGLCCVMSPAQISTGLPCTPQQVKAPKRLAILGAVCILVALATGTGVYLVALANLPKQNRFVNAARNDDVLLLGR